MNYGIETVFGTVTIEGGIISNNKLGIRMRSSGLSGASPPTVILVGGQIKDNDEVGIKLLDGTLTLTGGSISGKIYLGQLVRCQLRSSHFLLSL